MTIDDTCAIYIQLLIACILMSKIRSTLLDAHLSCLQSICISNNFSCSTRKATRCLAAQEFHTFQRTIQEVSMLFLWHLPVGFPWVSGAVLLFAWTLPNKKSNKLLMGNGVSPCFRKFSTSLRLRWFCKLMHQKRAGVEWLFSIRISQAVTGKWVAEQWRGQKSNTSGQIPRTP